MRPALLFLAHRVPYPPDKGDRIRTYHILRYLAERADVHLACLADEPVLPATREKLGQLCREVAIVPVASTRWFSALVSVARGRTVSEGAFSSSGLRGLLRSWAVKHDFHAALASASSLAPYLRMKELQNVPAIVDLVDIDSQKWLDYAAASGWPKSWLYRLEGQRLRRVEAGLSNRVCAATVVSEVEASLYRQFGDRELIRVVPNGVDLDYFRPAGPPTGKACVFVGALDYRPNIDAACWFSREVWPKLHGKDQSTRLYLVGRKPVPSVQQLAQIPGVEVIGQVPDVRPYVQKASVAVVPLHIARGVQNKVLEAMAMARPVVASPEALGGVQATPGTHLLAASKPAEWIEAIERLWASQELQSQLGGEGRRFVERHHRWQRCLAPLSALLNLPGDSQSSDEAA